MNLRWCGGCGLLMHITQFRICNKRYGFRRTICKSCEDFKKAESLERLAQRFRALGERKRQEQLKHMVGGGA